MRNLFYIDTYSVGHLHEMYDASSLMMFCNIYDKIDYFARKDSILRVTDLLNGIPTGVCFHHIFFISDYGRFPKIRRGIKQIQAVFLNIVIILIAPKNTDVIINYNTVISIFPLNLLCKLVNKRVLLVCHGEMQDIQSKRPVSWLFRVSIKFFNRDDIVISKNLWFAVLGNCIRTNLLPLVSQQVQRKLLFFDHSAIFTNQSSKEISHEKGKLLLGYIGGYRISKGADVFVNLARCFKGNTNVEFRIIGNIKGNRDLLEDAGVVIPEGVGNIFLNRKELYNHILSLDYVVFCFPPEGYKYTASGSVFDALDCNIPILALKNDYFDYMFDKYGRFGFLENDFESLKKRIVWLLEHKPPQWDMENVKKSLSPQNVAKEFCESKWFNV